MRSLRSSDDVESAHSQAAPEEPMPASAARVGRTAPVPKSRAEPASSRHGIPPKLRIMISSRCDDSVPGSPKRRMTELRRAIKDELEGARLTNWAPFEVRINEDEPALEAGRDATQHCIDQALEADVLLALVNGNAGWAAEGGTVGICHLELKTVFDAAPHRIRVIDLGRAPAPTELDLDFWAWLDRQHLWTRRVVGFDAGLAAAREAVIEALGRLAIAGSREARRGKYHSGDALEWSRLDYQARAARMCEVARKALPGRPGGGAQDEAVVRVAGRDVLVRIHAIPGPTAEPAARERVGQPFLRDHDAAAALEHVAGPVHLVLCHRGVTEGQAARMLGFPDAMLVSPPFGVWAADTIQKTQLIFLAQCRDETATRTAVQRAFEWLDSSGEGSRLVERAEARARIARAIAAEAGERTAGQPAQPGGKRGRAKRDTPGWAGEPRG